jgi:uncharacterized membrane protein YbhN (UPF0104 family)
LKFHKILRIVIPSVLLFITAVYLAKLLPAIDLSLFSLLSYKRWLSLVSIFILFQLLNLYHFKLVINSVSKVDSLFKLFQVLFASLSLNYVSPFKLGTPVRLFLFKEILGIPYTSGVTTVIATTGLDVLVMFTLVISISAWIFISPLAGFACGVTVLICMFGLASIYRKLYSARTEKSSWIGRFFSELANLSPLIILYATLISAAKSFLHGFAGWIVCTGLGAATSLAEFICIYFASHLAGLLSLIPMGIGVKDASVIELLRRAGASSSVTIGFVAIDRLVWSLLPLLIGLFAGWHLGVKAMIRTADKEITV